MDVTPVFFINNGKIWLYKVTLPSKKSMSKVTKGPKVFQHKHKDCASYKNLEHHENYANHKKLICYKCCASHKNHTHSQNHCASHKNHIGYKSHKQKIWNNKIKT